MGAGHAIDFGSNSGMENSLEMRGRLTNLEIKASFMEDMLEQLDQVVVRQQAQIDLLVREVAALKQSGNPGAGGEAGAARNLRDELPPHF
jgi:SlyX protein